MIEGGNFSEVKFVDVLATSAPRIGNPSAVVGPFRLADHGAAGPKSRHERRLAMIPLRRSASGGVMVFSSAITLPLNREQGHDFLDSPGVVAAICWRTP